MPESNLSNSLREDYQHPLAKSLLHALSAFLELQESLDGDEATASDEATVSDYVSQTMGIKSSSPNPLLHRVSPPALAVKFQSVHIL